ncbi:MAG: 18 kDa heat shock protein [Acidimicrobiaceae bacterium]|jgi:HSP20 family protein|nr:18 kDa heat shock protein [Acidimicrobiaceae bacterium]
MLMRQDPFRQLDRWTEQVLGPAARAAMVPMDAYRKGDMFVIHFDLPGVDPSSIELTVEKNTLTVKAERRWVPSDDAEVLISERPQGSFTRQILLGDGLDADRIDARYEQGVLTVTIPVSESVKPRRVEVAVGGEQKLVGAKAS